MRRRWVTMALGLPLAAVALVTLATWVYIELIRDEAPERLTVDPSAPGSDRSTATGATTGGGGSGDVEGVWTVTAGSQAGYRVREVLFGQSAEAVGRTDGVTGQVTIDGTTVIAASFTVDMTTVESDQARRDNQFRGRIMDVQRYPTATFALTTPIALGSLPADGREATVAATGDLTLRGTTKRVTLDLAAERSGSSIRVSGRMPVVFEEWGIPNPSFGPAQTEDRGELEFLLVLVRSGGPG